MLYGHDGRAQKIDYVSAPDLAPPLLTVAQTNASSSPAPDRRPPPREISRARGSSGASGRPSAARIADLIPPPPIGGPVTLNLPGGVTYEVGSKLPGYDPTTDVYSFVATFAITPKVQDRRIAKIPGPKVVVVRVTGYIVHVHNQRERQYYWYYTEGDENNSKQHYIGQNGADAIQQFFDDLGAQAGKGMTGMSADTTTAHAAATPAGVAAEQLAPLPGVGPLRALLVSGTSVVAGTAQGGVSLAVAGSGIGSPVAAEFEIPPMPYGDLASYSWFDAVSEAGLSETTKYPFATPAQANGSVVTSNCGGVLYEDPSGTVVTTKGRPVARARVTLSHATTARSHFSSVPNGSSLMSPGNRVNPGLTTQSGTFGWDVLPGYYEVTVARSGCRPAT